MHLDGLGVDIELSSRMRRWVEIYSWNELQMIFTKDEWKAGRKRPEWLAICFSAKESVIKAIGIFHEWANINIQIEKNGLFYFQLMGKSKKECDFLAEKKGFGLWFFYNKTVITMAFLYV